MSLRLIKKHWPTLKHAHLLLFQHWPLHIHIWLLHIIYAVLHAIASALGQVHTVHARTLNSTVNRCMLCCDSNCCKSQTDVPVWMFYWNGLSSQRHICREDFKWNDICISKTMHYSLLIKLVHFICVVCPRSAIFSHLSPAHITLQLQKMKARFQLHSDTRSVKASYFSQKMCKHNWENEQPIRKLKERNGRLWVPTWTMAMNCTGTVTQTQPVTILWHWCSFRFSSRQGWPWEIKVERIITDTTPYVCCIQHIQYSYETVLI